MAGRERGYVTFAELNRVFAAMNQYPPIDLETPYDVIRRMGIEVVARVGGSAE